MHRTPQQPQSPLSNGLASGSTSTTSGCPPASTATTTVAAGGCWQVPTSAYNAYQLPGGQVVSLPFGPTSATASADHSLLLAAVLQQQQQQHAHQQQQRAAAAAAAAMLMAPTNNSGAAVNTETGSNADGSSGSTITSSSIGATPIQAGSTVTTSGAVYASTNGVCNGVSVPVPVPEAWLSAKRAAHPGADSLSDYNPSEGTKSAAICNGAGFVEQAQQQQRVGGDMFTAAMGDNPSSLAVAGVAPAFAYPPAGYCHSSNGIPPQLAAMAANPNGVGGGAPAVASLFNFYGLPYPASTNGAAAAAAAMATGSYLPTAGPVYSAPPHQSMTTGAGDSQASIAALALNNMLSQQHQSSIGQPVVQAHQPIAGATPVFSANPHQMANIAATLANLQQQQPSTDLCQLAAANVASATAGSHPAFQQPHHHHQQQQQAFVSALIRAQQLQHQQQLAAAQMAAAAAMQQVAGGTAYTSQSPASCLIADQYTVSNGLNGLTAAMPSPYAMATCYPGLVQLQNNPVTNVAYINENGNLLETLPICRDFKAGKCNRNGECRYVHLLDENVEVHHGRVTVCRDAAKGRCTRLLCKYFHVPLFAISAHRSMALNSVLHNNNNTSNGHVAASGGIVMTGALPTVVGSSVVNQTADANVAAVNTSSNATGGGGL